MELTISLSIKHAALSRLHQRMLSIDGEEGNSDEAQQWSLRVAFAFAPSIFNSAPRMLRGAS
ncbi:hypothetical protein BK655_14000 [Pseudomonas brassicacearum]|jgi:hypothetical protein|nr:hypothetical protein A0U95_01700 [Pseudomonas brassicacearum]PJH89442.1 hypothetical protein CVG87_07770 [Pseudomonas sp. WCS365]ROM83684.1 hypothetical protein BK655_14000 [Pseudomonas brassicacearum]ROM93078.1 hypothetical protein BK656_18265 [Pseudomonas brassicacearum]RON07135.1 hypothetical protein BK657_04185 [Pseudomonas brassicacearum]